MRLVDGIIGAGDVEGAAAGLPCAMIVLPGLAAGLAGGRDRIGLPLGVAGPGVERRHPVAQAAVAAGAADDNGILERERGGGEFEVGLVEQALVPHHRAGLLVGRDDPAGIAGDRDHEILPQRERRGCGPASRAWGPSSTGTCRRCRTARRSWRRSPQLSTMYMKPSSTSGVASRLSLVEVPPSPMANSSRRFLTLSLLMASSAREALRGVVVMVHQPVLRLRIDETLVGQFRGGRGHGTSGDCRAAECNHRHRPSRQALSGQTGFPDRLGFPDRPVLRFMFSSLWFAGRAPIRRGSTRSRLAFCQETANAAACPGGGGEVEVLYADSPGPARTRVHSLRLKRGGLGPRGGVIVKGFTPCRPG